MAQSLANRIAALTGFTIDTTGYPTTADTNDFIYDGVNDVRSRAIRAFPEKKPAFAITLLDAGKGITVSSPDHVVSVVREATNEDDNRPATQIPEALATLAQDKSSMHYRSIYNPAWYYQDNKIKLIPASSSYRNFGTITAIVPKIGKGITSLALNAGGSGTGTGTGFLYATDATGEGFLGSCTVNSGVCSDPIVIRPGVNYSDSPTINFVDHRNGLISSGSFNPTVSSIEASISSTDLNGFVPHDMEQLVVEYVAMRSILQRMGVILSEYSEYASPTITKSTDGSATTAAKNVSISELNNDYEYIQNNYDFDVENIDVTKWFQEAGDMISNQEDLELASKQLDKINGYLSYYNAEQKNQENTYQSKFQKLDKEFSWLIQRYQTLNINYASFFMDNKKQRQPQQQEERQQA